MGPSQALNGAHGASGNISDEGGAPRDQEVVHIDDVAGLRPAWTAWSLKRRKWAEREVPVRKAAGLFERLHELHTLFQREGERFEMLVGDGILSWPVRSGGIHHPVIVRPVQLEFSPEVPSFTVREIGAASSFQLNAFRGVQEASERQAKLGAKALSRPVIVRFISAATGPPALPTPAPRTCSSVRRAVCRRWS